MHIHTLYTHIHLAFQNKVESVGGQDWYRTPSNESLFVFVVACQHVQEFDVVLRVLVSAEVFAVIFGPGGAGRGGLGEPCTHFFLDLLVFLDQLFRLIRFHRLAWRRLEQKMSRLDWVRIVVNTGKLHACIRTNFPRSVPY